jgi:hypothetical protein
MKTITSVIRNLDVVHDDVAAWFRIRHTVAGRAIRDRHQRIFADISIRLGGGVDPYLWSDQDIVTKLRHNSVQVKYRQTIMYLSAHESSGLANLCPFATPSCIAGCLGKTAGRMAMDNVQTAQLARTTLLVNEPLSFAILFIDGLERAARKAKRLGAKLVARPNGDSDVPWERVQWLLDLASKAGVAQWQDYTKWPKGRRKTRRNYYLAPSVSERVAVADVRPRDVVVVDVGPNDPLPVRWNGMLVTDGDYDNGDLRFLDKPQRVTLLRAKGALRGIQGDERGFVKPSQV